MYQIKTLWSNCNEANIKASYRKDQNLPDMVVPDLKDSNLREFEIDFHQEARIIIGITTILLGYVIGENEVGNQGKYWSSREERLKNCTLFTGEPHIGDS